VTTPGAGLLKIALVQTELVWEDPGANLGHFTELLASEVSSTDTDLVVLPEMFTTGFSMSSAQFAEPMSGDTVSWMKSKSQQGGYAIGGSVMMQERGNFYNRFILCHPDAEIITYDKKHLFRMSTEHDHYSAGARRVGFSLNDFQICPQICYDLRFPVWSRHRGDYDVLLYVANWPSARRSHWLSLLRARAIENQCYVVGVNRVGADKNLSYSGDSIVYDFHGETLLDLKNETCVGHVTLDQLALNDYRQSFPVWKDADNFDFIEDLPD